MDKTSPAFFITLGPIGILRVGAVWSIDIGRRGIYGIGWNPRYWRTRRIKG